MTEERILTVADAVDLGLLVETTIHNQKVAWLDEYDNLIVGVARHFVVDPDRPMFIGDNIDVRDSYLRVTTTSGFESFPKVDDILPKIRSGHFVCNYDHD